MWDYLATAPTGEITSLAVFMGFVVFPILDGVWSLLVDVVERVR